MKNTLITFLLCTALPFLCTSCFKEVDLGFPDTVAFTSEGGMETVTGNTEFTHADIKDYKTGGQGEVQKTDDGIYYNTYKWLKVEYREYGRNDRELKIYAEPNTTGKSRKLHIEVYAGPEYAVMAVVQN